MGFRTALWKLKAGVDGNPVFQRYEHLMQSQWFLPAELQARTAEALQRVLLHSARSVPFYRRRNAKADSLESFGTISRDELINGFGQLQSTDPGPLPHWQTSSSGSSGQPVTVVLDKECNSWRTASAWRGDTFGTGLGPDARQLAIWGNPMELKLTRRMFQRALNFYHNRFIVDGFTITPESVREIHRVMWKLRPKILYGYPASLHGFVLSALEQGLEPIPVWRLMTTGEQLNETQKEAIAQYFGVTVCERYGSREFGSMAHQCEHGVWHIHQEHLHFEVRLPDGRISDSGTGDLLVTSLHNFTMPLIRYEIGDMANLTPADCQCGRGLRTFHSLLGRPSEFIYTPSGAWINANHYHVLLRDEPVRHFRFIQDTPGELRMLIVPLAEMTPERLELLRKQGEAIARHELKLHLEVVDHIDPLPNGKSPGVLNLLPRPELPGRLDV
ncbi:phenylacetate--CoA ligase family protein [bacterium]|nr:phenylacetate--CoA ligase family protein [bacterium]